MISVIVLVFYHASQSVVFCQNTKHFSQNHVKQRIHIPVANEQAEGHKDPGQRKKKKMKIFLINEGWESWEQVKDQESTVNLTTHDTEGTDSFVMNDLTRKLVPHHPMFSNFIPHRTRDIPIENFLHNSLDFFGGIGYSQNFTDFMGVTYDWSTYCNHLSAEVFMNDYSLRHKQCKVWQQIAEQIRKDANIKIKTRNGDAFKKLSKRVMFSEEREKCQDMYRFLDTEEEINEVKKSDKDECYKIYAKNAGAGDHAEDIEMDYDLSPGHVLIIRTNYPKTEILIIFQAQFFPN